MFIFTDFISNLLCIIHIFIQYYTSWIHKFYSYKTNKKMKHRTQLLTTWFPFSPTKTYNSRLKSVSKVHSIVHTLEDNKATSINCLRIILKIQVCECLYGTVAIISTLFQKSSMTNFINFQWLTTTIAAFSTDLIVGEVECGECLYEMNEMMMMMMLKMKRLRMMMMISLNSLLDFHQLILHLQHRFDCFWGWVWWVSVWNEWNDDDDDVENEEIENDDDDLTKSLTLFCLGIMVSIEFFMYILRKEEWVCECSLYYEKTKQKRR